MDKLETLVKKIGSNHLFIGEIGFRRDDSKAYIRPWDWSKRYGDKVDAVHYDLILAYLLIHLKLEYMGIWS